MITLCLEHWYDEITLNEIATRAGVALQTVINHFGSKEGLLRATLDDPRLTAEFGGHRFEVEHPTYPEAVDMLVDSYERSGDAALRFLALENRIPALETFLAFGRAQHRGWNEAVFAEAIERATPESRERIVAELIAATDVYVWKLFRRDMHLSRDAAVATITAMVEAIIRSIEHEKGTA
ncbi:MAG: TetR/AcrR family transcriptional regulator [Actinobacteria bacterium]|nr:TetR/AcrR family transcriptional regulator [Actinomycetota bacterium]